MVAVSLCSWELTDKNGQVNPTPEQVASGFTNAQGIFYIQEHLTPAEFLLKVDAAPNFNLPATSTKVGLPSAGPATALPSLHQLEVSD